MLETLLKGPHGLVIGQANVLFCDVHASIKVTAGTQVRRDSLI